jgi:TetR/AcrR family transcriptional repressor of nem operon
MRMRPEQKEAARAAIVAAAGRRFRLSGQAGVGIDALAGETGQTSGAIFAHFRSKAEVFAAVVEAGLGRLLSGIERTKAASGAWAAAFAAGYLSRGHRRGIAEGCLLPGLSADVARAPADVRETYGRSVDLALGLLADGCAGAGDRERREKAIAASCCRERCLTETLLTRCSPPAGRRLRRLQARTPLPRRPVSRRPRRSGRCRP